MIFANCTNHRKKNHLLPSVKSRNREGYLSLSEILLIEILFHFSPYNDFKHYYLYGIMTEHRDKFGKPSCYQRFVNLKKQLFMPLTILLHSISGEETGIYFADATSLKVCRNKRIHRHKFFDGFAARGKTTMGWFLADLMKNLKGKCYADKAYIGKKIFAKLWKNGLHLVVGIRSNMKNYLMPFIITQTSLPNTKTTKNFA